MKPEFLRIGQEDCGCGLDRQENEVSPGRHPARSRSTSWSRPPNQSHSGTEMGWEGSLGNSERPGAELQVQR